jgi:hypothetical protein
MVLMLCYILLEALVCELSNWGSTLIMDDRRI